MIPGILHTSCRQSRLDSRDSRHCTAISRLFEDWPWINDERTVRKGFICREGRDPGSALTRSVSEHKALNGNHTLTEPSEFERPLVEQTRLVHPKPCGASARLDRNE